MKLSPLTETLAFFAVSVFISSVTISAALGVDPFKASAPLMQPIAKVIK
jgi:hypothetical protein